MNLADVHRLISAGCSEPPDREQGSLPLRIHIELFHVDRYSVEQAEGVNAGREAVAVATDRYREGKASYYEVLEAQQQLYPAENVLSHIEAGRRLAVVQLYKALGGGWSLKDSEWSGVSAQVTSSRSPNSIGH
jgi:hypothetical protein